MRNHLPLGRRHPQTVSHLRTCPECAAAVRRRRQYLERLRQAPIPPASDDLTARLLARTEELARSRGEARGGHTAGIQDPTAAGRNALPLVPSARKPSASRAVAKVLTLSAGGTMAAAGVLAAGAFAAAGDPRPATAAGAAFSQASTRTPADGRALSAEQVNQLRSEGWACPELTEMGFHLESARAVVLDGVPAVELRLTDGAHYATVTEQRQAAASGGAAQAGTMQVLDSSPWSATYRTNGRTFVYQSDLPAGQADDAVPILARVAGQATEGISAGLHHEETLPADEPAATRLQRGINKIVALFAP